MPVFCISWVILEGTLPWHLSVERNISLRCSLPSTQATLQDTRVKGHYRIKSCQIYRVCRFCGAWNWCSWCCCTVSWNDWQHISPLYRWIHHWWEQIPKCVLTLEPFNIIILFILLCNLTTIYQVAKIDMRARGLRRCWNSLSCGCHSTKVSKRSIFSF